MGISLTVGPFGIVAGLSVVILKRYRPTMLFGWALTLVGLGMWTTLRVNTSTGTIIGYQVRANILSDVTLMLRCRFCGG